MPSAQEILSVQDLRVVFGTGSSANVAVQDVSLSVHEQETLCLVGESGSGKSVTALSIMGLLPETSKAVSGQVRFNGTDLMQMSEKARRKLNGNRISMIYQEPMRALNPLLTIGKQLTEPLTVHGNCTDQAAKEEALFLLKEVGLPHHAAMLRRFPFQLSGGQRQRVMIAMAMAMRPTLLIADEPTTALDVTVQAQILTLMQRLRSQHRTAILLITHDLGVVAAMAHRVAVMYAGRIVETATVDDLFYQPRHPYTQGLLKAIPRLDDKSKRLFTIPGQVPRQHAPDFSGCAFRPRCPLARTICEQEPPIRYDNATHWARCWLEAPEVDHDETT